MSSRIKGIPVKLYGRIKTGVDAFNEPVYAETTEIVENVLVSPSTSADMPDMLDLDGRKAVYTLAIPKGDRHEWAGRRVEFFGQSWRVLNIPVEGIEENIPLDWNRKVMVERYE